MISDDDIEALHGLHGDIQLGKIPNLKDHSEVLQRVADGCVAAGRADAGAIFARAKDRSITEDDVGTLAGIAMQVRLVAVLPAAEDLPPGPEPARIDNDPLLS